MGIGRSLLVRALLFTAVCSSLATLTFGQTASDRSQFVTIEAPVVALKGVRVIDGTGSAPREGQTIVIAGGKIKAVGAAVEVPTAAKVIELSGRTVTPGPEQRKLERAFVAAGGRLGVGSDANDFGHIAGYGNHRALDLLVEAGWQPLEVIRLVTSNGAALLSVGQSVGRVAPGWAADLIVVSGDPAKDIKELSKAEIVFKDGVGYDPTKLRAAVKGLVGWH